MADVLRRRSLVVACALLVGGCGGTRPAPRDAPPQESGEDAPAPLRAGDVSAGADAALTEPVCFAAERCDGLDSDCDGQLDEGCEGAAGGVIQAGLSWSGVGRLDLQILARGEAPTTPRGGCTADGLHVVRRSVAEHVRGLYGVWVVPDTTCAIDGPITASVAVVADGVQVGQYNVPVRGGPAEVVSLRVAPR